MKIINLATLLAPILVAIGTIPDIAMGTAMGTATAGASIVSNTASIEIKQKARQTLVVSEANLSISVANDSTPIAITTSDDGLLYLKNIYYVIDFE